MGLKRGRGDIVAAHKTFRKSVGVPTLTPPKFRRQLKTTVLTQDAPADYTFPTAPTGNEVFIELNQDPQNTPTATLRTTEEELLTTAALRSYRRTDDAQVETLDESLVDEADVFAALDALTTTADQLALGDGKAVLRRGTVPIVFPARRYEKSRPRRTPPEFQALIPTLDFGESSAGTAIEPTLSPDDISIIDEQTDSFRRRLRSVTQDLSSLPVSLLNSRTTKNKQVEHVLRTLEDDTTVPATPTALLDVSFEMLGDDTAIEEWDYVDSLFTEPSYSAEIEDPTPAKFRILVPTRKSSLLSTATSVSPPTLSAGELRHEVELINAFVKRDQSTTRSVTSLPVSLTEYVMTPKHQIATRLLTLASGVQTLTGDVGELTIEAEVENFGNSTSLKNKSTVPALFDEQSYSTEIADAMPEKFRVLVPTQRASALLAAASVSPPTLLTGELSRTTERVNAFVKKDTSTYRDTTSLPVSLISYRMTQDRQVATRTATLDTGVQLIVPDELTVEAEVDNLGNGTSLLQLAEVEEVFPRDSYTTSILNRIPERLRATIPLKKVEYEEAGAPSTNPTLLDGEFSRTETRVNDFVRRIELQKFNLTPPISPIVQFDYGLTEKFGGGPTRIVYTLDDHSALTIDEGQFILDSKIENLGNGFDVKTTEQFLNSPYPTLDGQDYDERLNIVIPYTQRVRAAGSGLGTAARDIKPIDYQRQEEHTVDISGAQALLDAYLLSYPGNVNIDLPDKLVSLAGIIESSVGEGASSETGSFAFTGNYSVSLELRASAQSSATLIPDAIPGIKQFWGNNIDCMHYHFFLANPVTPADVITRVTAILGSAPTSWPKYSPEVVTLVARGERASLQVVATSKGSATVNDSANSSTTAGGTGYSRERGLNVKTIRVSPTIHEELTVTGDTTDTEGISADATAEATGLGPAETSSESDSVTATVTPTLIPATSGDTAWPSSGKYIYRIDAQPHKYDRVQFHVIVVDATDFPS